MDDDQEDEERLISVGTTEASASLTVSALEDVYENDRKAVVPFVHPAYDVEEADRYYLKKAIMTVAKNKKLETLKLKDLYRHTYDSVERILNANPQHFRHMVRAAEQATEDEDAMALTTTRTVAELLDKLRIKTKWEDTERLAEIVLCLPEEPRTLAMSLLKRYEGYLEVYDNLVPAQDSLQMQLAVPEGTKPQVPVEVTVKKHLDEFMNKDCKDIVNLLLHNSYKIPRINIMVAAIEPGSTTVVFLIDKAFTENIIHSSHQVSPLWAFQELRVTRVHFGDFEWNVVQLLTQHFKEAIRSGLTGSMDFVGATKALPYQVYALVDPDISEKLIIRTVYGKIAQPYSEQEELVSGTADSEDSKGVESTSEMEEVTLPPKVEEEAELDDEGKIKETTDSGELLSRVQELEEELKNSEGKMMDLTHENMALVNHLKVCQKQKDHTEQEITSLKKRLFSMLSSQGGADKDSALTAPSDVRSKRPPHRWWLKVSAGSYDTSLLLSSPMKQAEGGREMDGEVVFRRDTKSNLLKAVSGTEWMYRRGALERGRRANLRRHQFLRFHRRWLADNVQKEEEDSCKLWLLQSSPDVGSVREREERQVDEGKMSEEVTGSGELLSRVQELEDKLKDSERKRMDLIQSNAALQKILKASRDQEVRAQQEMASLWERQGGADQDSAPTAPNEGPLKRIPRRWWLKVSAGSYDTSLLPSSPMKQAEGGREMEGEVVFRRDTKSNLLKSVSGTEWMYRRGALERGRQHQFTRYHRRWLADNVQKEEEESCKQWLLQSSPDVSSVREGEEQGLMSKVCKQALRDYQEKMAGVLIVENIILNLEPYLTKEEYLQVKGKLGNMAQVDELFRILLTKGNRHFKGFCHVLEDNGYQYWAQQLRSSTDGAETEGAEQDSAPTAPSEDPLKRIPNRWWLNVSAGSYDTSLLPSSPTEEAEGGREMEGEVVFRRDTKSNLLKAVSGTEWMYRRGALERGRRHQFTRYHRSWLADNVQKEEEETCKQWLLQSSPDVGSVREGEEQGLMSKVCKQALRDYQEKIAEVLIVENIILNLEPYLTKEEYLQVKGKLGNMAQVDELFRILLTKGNRHFKGFCHVLEDNGYQYWAQQLRSSTDGAETEGAEQDSAPTAPNEDPLKRIPNRWWLNVSAGSYDTSLLLSTPMEQAEGGREMEGEVVFRRDTKSNLLKAVSGTEWMYRRGALERGRQHQFTRYHRSWLADNVQKEEEESCKQWLLQSSPNVSSVREREEQGLMSKVYKQALRDYQEKIAQVLIVENIILNLEPYLTKEEYLQVKGKLGNMAQVDELFRILLTKGNRHFKGFCHVLEDNGYQYWAQQLRSSTDGAETEGAEQDSAPTAPNEDPLKRIPNRWWLNVSAGSYDTSLLLSTPMEQAEGGREMEGEVMFRRDTKSSLLKAVSGTEWMYRRGALERGRQSATAKLHQHQFTRYHWSWLADNVQKEEEESCKQWLLQSSPNVSSVREGEEQELTAYSRLKSDKKTEALDLLHSVTKNGYREQFLELAYDHGVPPAENGMEGHSAVHLIAEHGHVQLMRDLLTKELPEIAKVLQDGLHFREQLERAKKHQNMVTLKLGKYVKNKSKHGWRPLHFAVKACASQQVGERGKMVALLLLAQGDNSMLATQKMVRAKKSGEEPKRNESGGESPVHIAATCGTIPALELIWEWCDVFGTEGENGGKFELFKEPDEKGWTPLHHAVATNQSIVVEWLLEKRPLTRLSVDAPSEKGYTALMTAAEYNHNEMCELLLRNGAKVDCAAADGLTAVHLAAMLDNKELVELLLKRGASCKDQDKDGNTPLHIARKKYCHEAASVLENHDQTMLEVVNNDGYTPENIPREDKEFIPQEIRKRGSKAIQVYEEALKDGKTKIPHVKFVLLGETRHGKTSLLRLLEGEEFDPDSSSTDGIDCDLVSSKTVDGMDEEDWKKHDSLSYPEAVAGIVVSKLSQSDTPAIRQRSHPGDLTKEHAKRQIAKLFRPRSSVVPHSGHPLQRLHAQPPPHGVPVSEVASAQEQHKFQQPSSQLSVRLNQMAQTSQPQSGVSREHTHDPHQQQKHDTPVQEEGASRPQLPEESNPGTTGKHPEDTPARPLSDVGTGMAIQRAMSKVKDVEKLAFTTYDFAGQPLYRPMHHCFITQRAVFAIVYNAREFRDTPKEACSKFISYWFNTVSAYTESYTEKKGRQLENKPPVFLVGTHRGPYEAEDSSRSFKQLSAEEMQYVTGVLEDHFENNDKCGRYVPHITSKSYNFVESSLKGKKSGAQELRSRLREKAKSLPYMTEEYPVRWLKLEEDLTSKDGLILLADVKTKARELNFHFAEETESKELDEALRFFHEIGVITYPRSLPHIFLKGCDQEARQLEEVILCGPAQLPNVMKKVVNFKELSHMLSADERMALIQTSVASEEALAVLFADVLLTGSISDKKKALQCFCLLLRAYGLIVKMSTGRDEASHQQEGRQSPPGPQYLIPCLLKEMHNIPKPARMCFSFVADFLGYLPQEVFMGFVCLAALRADHSILNRDKTDDTEYHLKQDYCSVEGLAEPGDAWYISCYPSSHKMVFQVSKPHGYTGTLLRFVYCASKLLDQLRTDMKLNGLFYRVGKDYLCKSCKAEKFIKLHENDEIKCSCTMSINADDLLNQTITGMEQLDPGACTPLPTATPPPPDIADIVEGLNHKLDAKWRHFGTFLLVDYQTMEAIRLDNGGRPDDCMLDLLGRWTSNQAGTGPSLALGRLWWRQ